MSVKANLRVVLLANEITVAESDDPVLWQHNLATITGRRASPRDRDNGVSSPALAVDRPVESLADSPLVGDGGVECLKHFVNELQVDVATVQGACDPGREPPYMHLDVRAWQEFRRNTASRGTSSVPPVVLAATLLVLWFRSARLGTVTISQAQAVLATIDARDKNPARGLKNCNWLQTREDVIKLNPARFDSALEVARAFCSGQPLESV